MGFFSSIFGGSTKVTTQQNITVDVDVAPEINVDIDVGLQPVAELAEQIAESGKIQALTLAGALKNQSATFAKLADTVGENLKIIAFVIGGGFLFTVYLRRVR